MVRHLIDPQLLADTGAHIVYDFWADIPASRVIHQRYIADRLKETPLLDTVQHRDQHIPGLGGSPDIRIRIYYPSQRPTSSPALLWIHGGGFVVGTIDTEVPVMQMLAQEVSCIIVAVEYRLAPENPFPAPLDDCYATLLWMRSNAEQLGIDRCRIAVGGISAGAGLVAALMLKLRDETDIEVIFQMLLCPMLDDRNQLPSTYLDLSGIAWERESNRKAWAAYLGSQPAEQLPTYAVPGRVSDLNNLPAAYISVGSVDLFRDECIDYARRLLEAGVPTELHVHPGGIHAFEFKVSGADISGRARRQHIDALKLAFGKAGAGQTA